MNVQSGITHHSSELDTTQTPNAWGLQKQNRATSTPWDKVLREKKQWTIDTCEETEGPQKSKKPDTQKNYHTTHLHEISRKGPTMKTWRRSVFS